MIDTALTHFVQLDCFHHVKLLSNSFIFYPLYSWKIVYFALSINTH